MRSECATQSDHGEQVHIPYRSFRDCKKDIQSRAAAIEAYNALQHNYATGLALRNYDGMETLWSDDPEIQDYRDLLHEFLRATERRVAVGPSFFISTNGSLSCPMLSNGTVWLYVACWSIGLLQRATERRRLQLERRKQERLAQEQTTDAALNEAMPG